MLVCTLYCTQYTVQYTVPEGALSPKIWGCKLLIRIMVFIKNEGVNVQKTEIFSKYSYLFKIFYIFKIDMKISLIFLNFIYEEFKKIFKIIGRILL